MKTLLLCLLAFLTCSHEKPATALPGSSPTPTDSLVCLRFPPPPGFERLPDDAASFTHYLRRLPLKPPGARVRFYDGREKANPGIYAAVVDLPIGRRDLHQCADAVIRLRAEYLWRTRQFDRIRFHLTNGFPVEYDRWRRGGRVQVKDNQCVWKQSAAASDTYDTFWAYLEFVFSYAGTLSLAREMKPVRIADLRPGDVFVQGGSPGHAVIVVDVATDAAGKKAFLLAQSYMPAQEIQILWNPAHPGQSAWYAADFGETLVTPQWTFSAGDLKGFSEN